MQRKSLLGWWIKVRRRLPVAAVCVAVGVLLIAETALGQRTQRRVIPACTSPEFAPRITPSPVKVPVGGKRTVTTAMLCDIESLFLSSAEALAIWLVDGDTLSKTTSTAGSDRLGLLMSSRGTDVPVPADQLKPLFNAIKRELTCPKEDPKIFGLTARGNFSGDLDSREGRPPSCVEPIVPTKADHFDRADLMVQVEPRFDFSLENTLDFFPGNISGNPEAELTVQACCISGGPPPGDADPPPSTPLNPGPEETNLYLKELALILSRTYSGIPPPATVYEDSGMPVEESVNSQTEVKQDNAPHAAVIKMVEEALLVVTTAISNLFPVSATGEPNAQEVIGTVTVAGPFP